MRKSLTFTLAHSQGEDLYVKRYIIVGRKTYKDKHRLKNNKYYILVVRPTSRDGEYKRVGVGLIQSGYILRQRLNIQVI